jgi:hypothetical protein
MVHLELTEDEVERLRSLCLEDLSELRMEIADTDRQDFRDELKVSKRFLESLIARLLLT